MPKLTFTFVTNFFNHVTSPLLLPILIKPNTQNYKKYGRLTTTIFLFMKYTN